MKRWLLAVLAALMFSGLQVCAGEPVVIGERMQIASSVLNEERAYSVALPPSYATEPARRYPVLYLLDAQDMFAHVSAVVDQLSRYGDIPEMLVVGVDSTARLRDLTPTDWSQMNGEDGGGPKFKRFLGEELIPRIDRAYRTDDYRILFGHSLGGLFALYSATDPASPFRAHLAIAPTLDWDAHWALRQAEAGFGGKRSAQAFLYVARGDDLGQALADFDGFVAAVRKHAAPDLRVHAAAFPDEMHVTIPLVAAIDALRQLYAGYRLHPDDADKGLAYADEHFAKVSKNMGITLPMPETVVNDFGYGLLGKDKVDEAIAAFERNVKQFPQSANAADSLADGYAKAKRWNDALRSSQRALELAEAQKSSNLEYFRTQVKRFEDAVASTPNDAQTPTP